MYLSRVKGGQRHFDRDVQNPPLADPYEEHAFIWSLFEKMGISSAIFYRRVDEQAGLSSTCYQRGSLKRETSTGLWSQTL